ncbi:lysoplasmalogenase [Bowmanella dokdonensis]|uniref:Lysoplasmalogenase n=1 Tax=Bowmanella dokdonensis TaxID=751969 RepID=A0A939DQL1_9ALTE|nr:lysoplasmalogenase [Bowmanella dokdonensis]MBN7826572.1 lysoplasmalogenase [Bowmanella dokdonensis]
MRSTHWNLVFAGSSLFYLFSLSFRPYPLDYLFKALPIVWLMILVLRNASSNKYLLLLALAFSATGDVLLALPLRHSFELGLGAFLLAQATYSINFWRFRQWQSWKIWPLLTVAGFAVFMLWQLLPSLDTMRVPVLTYLLVICVMAATAVLADRRGHWLIAGAACFLLSDALLAWNLFLSPLSHAPYTVMITYYAAQFCLVNGALIAAPLASDEEPLTADATR